jgi:excisionase family DNA binding protein
MFWNVNQTASFLGLSLFRVYYLLGMGEIEAYKIGRAWRVMPGNVKEYKTKLAA